MIFTYSTTGEPIKQTLNSPQKYIQYRVGSLKRKKKSQFLADDFRTVNNIYSAQSCGKDKFSAALGRV
jgi:hypothetical protein